MSLLGSIVGKILHPFGGGTAEAAPSATAGSGGPATSSTPSTPSAPGSSGGSEPVDVAAVLTSLAEKNPQTLDWRHSIVDLMKLLGLDSGLASRKQLADWMIASKTGLSRLRAGLPAGWKAGDKTGSGAAGALNDIAILWPSAGRAPVLVCAYTDGNRAGDAAQDRALAEIGGIVAARFA